MNDIRKSRVVPRVAADFVQQLKFNPIPQGYFPTAKDFRRLVKTFMSVDWFFLSAFP